MASRASWLPSVIRDAGVHVEGWASPQGEGDPFEAIEAIVIHDTVTTDEWSVEQVGELVEEGRDDVPGPLYNVGFDRDETAHFIADGSANHNGYGDFGNESLGFAFYTAGALEGHVEPASAGQQDVVARAAAAVCLHLGLPVERVVGHKETDPTRKPDPHGVDMDAFRELVRQYMDGEVDEKPAADDDEEDFMPVDVVTTEKAVYLIDHPYRIHLKSEGEADYFKNLAGSEDNPQYAGPWEWDEDRVQKHPERKA